MSSILFQDLKVHAEALLADFRAGVAHTEERFVELLHKIEGIAPQVTLGPADPSSALFAGGADPQPGLMQDGTSSAGVSSGAITAIGEGSQAAATPTDLASTSNGMSEASTSDQPASPAAAAGDPAAAT